MKVAIAIVVTSALWAAALVGVIRENQRQLRQVIYLQQSAEKQAIANRDMVEIQARTVEVLKRAAEGRCARR